VAVEAVEIDPHFLRDREEPAAAGLDQTPINQQRQLGLPILVAEAERKVIITLPLIHTFYQELVLVDQA
jgi:hypothetical protein